MKICILGNQSRAISNFWTILMKHMQKYKHEIICIVPNTDQVYNEKLQSLNIKLIHYDLSRKGLNPFDDYKTFKQLLNIFKEIKPDLLFTSTIKPVIYGCLAAKIAKIPNIYAVITGLGYAFEKDNLFKKCIFLIGSLLYKFALNNISGIFFQNKDDAETFKQSHILNNKSNILFARGTGVDTEKFALTKIPDIKQTLNFLLIGRLLIAKGIIEFANAARLLKKDFPTTKFSILGPKESGPGSLDINEIKKWEEEGIIEYLGESIDVRPYIAKCHALVLPSWREGVPTAIMEGMSMGRCAIVTDVPGCREVIEDGFNGYLCKKGDYESLAKAIRKLIKNPNDILIMGDRSREIATKNFDAHIVANKMIYDMKIGEKS